MSHNTPRRQASCGELANFIIASFVTAGITSRHWKSLSRASFVLSDFGKSERALLPFSIALRKDASSHTRYVKCENAIQTRCSCAAAVWILDYDL